MHYAAYALCKKLHEVSGWRNTTYQLSLYKSKHGYTVELMPRQPGAFVPAFSTRYFQGIVPGAIKGADLSSERRQTFLTDFQAALTQGIDQACQFTIQLFEQGVLTKGSE